MSMDAPIGEAKKQEFKVSIQITESEDGTLGLQVLGQAVKLIDCRKLLQWALNRTQDEILTELVNKTIEQKMAQRIHPNGFRTTAVGKFLGL